MGRRRLRSPGLEIAPFAHPFPGSPNDSPQRDAALNRPSQFGPGQFAVLYRKPVRACGIALALPVSSARRPVRLGAISGLRPCVSTRLAAASVCPRAHGNGCPEIFGSSLRQPCLRSRKMRRMTRFIYCNLQMAADNGQKRRMGHMGRMGPATANCSTDRARPPALPVKKHEAGAPAKAEDMMTVLAPAQASEIALGRVLSRSRRAKRAPRPENGA